MGGFHFLYDRILLCCSLVSSMDISFKWNHSGTEGIKPFKQHLQSLQTEEGRLKGLSFAPHDTDLFIVTTPKAGTTWLQQMVHQLRTGGDMEFAEIREVVPYVE